MTLCCVSTRSFARVSNVLKRNGLVLVFELDEFAVDLVSVFAGQLQDDDLIWFFLEDEIVVKQVPFHQRLLQLTLVHNSTFKVPNLE